MGVVKHCARAGEALRAGARNTASARAILYGSDGGSATVTHDRTEGGPTLCRCSHQKEISASFSLPPAPPDPARSFDVAPERRTIGRMAHQLPSLSKSRSSSKTWASRFFINSETCQNCHKIREIVLFFGNGERKSLRYHCLIESGRTLRLITPNLPVASCATIVRSPPSCPPHASSFPGLSQFAPCAITHPISQLPVAPVYILSPPAAPQHAASFPG